MPVRVLLSPSEPALAEKLKDDAITSSLPEEKGADILIYTNQGLVGLQRKEVPNDFISSFTDGRMARETALLVKSCKFSRIIGEGRFRYFPNGKVVTGRIDRVSKKPEPSRFTRNHIRGMIFDLEFIKGIVVDWTDDLDDTVSYIRALPDFVNREKHLGLYARPSAKGTWYKPSAKDIELWILQSFEGIGPAIADNIIRHFDGQIPIGWTCSFKQLSAVPGLSMKRAQVMWESLTGVNAPTITLRSLDDLRKNIKEASGG